MVTGSAFAIRALNYVRNNIETEFRFGLSKGARGALIDQSGTAFDQAHLLVELLREGGVSASYQIGTITLNSQEFGLWSGVISSLNETGQTVTVDAKTACQFLADGGIPASVNGATSCGALTGALTTVTLGHVWVTAGGQSYDPSFKVYTLHSGADIPALMQCGTRSAPTCAASAQSAALSGASQGLTSGFNYIQGVNEASLNAALATYASRITSAVDSQSASTQAKALFGYREINEKSTASLAAAHATLTSSIALSGEITDRFRTKLTISYNAMSVSVFADEIYGKRVRMACVFTQSGNDYYCPFTDQWSGHKLTLYVESAKVGESQLLAPNASGYIIGVAVDHPYMANSGLYGDDNLDLFAGVSKLADGSYQRPFVSSLVMGLGSAKSSLSKHYENVQAVSPSMLTPCYNSDYEIPDCEQKQQILYGARFLVQQSQLYRLVESISKSRIENHHALGLVFSGQGGTMELYSTGSYAAPSQPAAFNIESAISSASLGLTPVADGGGRMAALASSALEGNALQQAEQSWDGLSSASMFVLANRNGLRFIQIPASSWSAGSSLLTNYGPSRLPRIAAFAGAGYDLVLPTNGKIGQINMVAGGAITLGTGPIAAFAPDAASYMVEEVLKGGAAPTSVSLLDPIKDYQNLAAKSDEKLKVVGSPISGAASIQDVKDVVTGAGAFPLSLPFVRSYDSTATTSYSCSLYGGGESFAYPCANEGSDAQFSSSLGGGWTHNYQIALQLGSDGLENMGASSSYGAARMAAAVQILGEIATSPALSDRVIAMFVAQFGLNGAIDNTATISGVGPSGKFVKLYDQTYRAIDNSGNRLTQSGSRSGPFGLAGAILYSYIGVSFAATGKDGQVVNFSPDGEKYVRDGNVYTIVPSLFRADKWSFADGNQILFNHDLYVSTYDASGNPSSKRSRLLSVRNALGRSLTFEHSELWGAGSGLMAVDKVTDDVGRETAIQPVLTTGLPYWSLPGHVTKLSVTRPGASLISYDYAVTGTPVPEFPSVTSKYILVKAYQPSSSTVPANMLSYDKIGNAAGSVDRNGHETSYFLGFAGSEVERVGEVRTPGQAVSATISDAFGREIRAVDALERITSTTYNDAGYVLRIVRPEGSAVEYGYDFRGNRVSECQIAKGRVAWSALNVISEQIPKCDAASGDLVTTTAYMEGPTVRADQCVNMKTCNRPSYEIDAKGNRATYTWSATHGQLLTQTTGLNAAGTCALAGGTCPTVTYGYTPFTGTDGASLYLLTSKQELISSGVTTTTTYEYDTANKFVLKSSVADSGGLSLRTCYKFDPIGNLISKTEPRAGLAVCS